VVAVSLKNFGIGLDVGLDPFEVLDLATGLLLIDLRDDDY
jgi:hypothetical protein